SNQLQANNVALAGAVDQPGHAPALAKVNSAISKAQEAAALADIFTVSGEPRSVVGGLADFLTKWKEAGRLMNAAASELGDSNPAGLGLKALGSMLDLITSVVSDETLEALNALDKILLREPPSGSFAGIDASTPEGLDCLKDMRDAIADQLQQAGTSDAPSAGWDLFRTGDDRTDPTEKETAVGRSIDPLIIDLDGDGVELTARDDPTVFFDFAENGVRFRTSWFSPDDGMVVRDSNGNGRVDDASEFFGNETTDAFSDLAQFDDNADGVIDFQDAIWLEMAVWRDLNSDGQTQDGELLSMQDAGVARINLDRVETDFDVNGANVAAVGSWTHVDGTTRDAWAVFFDTTAGASNVPLPDGVSIPDRILELPILHGGGSIPDLHKAMTLDAGLEEMVVNYTENLSDLTGSQLWEGMAEIMMRWFSGTIETDIDWHQDVLTLDNPRSLLEPLLENFFDTEIELPEPASIRDIGVTFTEDVWTEFNFRNLVDSMLARFLSQITDYEIAQSSTDEEENAARDGVFKAVDDNVTYNPITGTTQTGLDAFVRSVVIEMPNDRSEALAYIDQVAPAMRAVRPEIYQETRPAWFPHVEDSSFRNDLRQFIDEQVNGFKLDPWLADFLFFRVLAEYWGEGTSGDDVLDPHRTKYGFAAGRDYTYFNGGEGDDEIISAPYSGPIIPYLPLGGRNIEVTGSQNRTLIVYREGDGDDIVDMSAATGQHMVFLPDIASTDAVFRVSPEGGGDFLLTFTNGGSITFKGLGNVTNGGLEIRYADNVVQDEDDVRLQYTDFADIVVGDPGDNVVTGGPGDDLLRGDSGDDLYIYRRGDGHDVIEEVYETVLDTSSGQILRASNQLWLQDIEKSEVRFSRESEN
ncbi:MAG: hypothetical protein AAGD47_15375, partial [Pseudomonadota bacterium]